MSYEVDVLAVGDNSKSGDAIALRYGDFSHRSLHKVVVIDGGFKENGEELVKLIQETYGTTFVDLVISTHPDADHIAGLSVVLEELAVGALWMHQPWNHGKAVADLRQGRFSKQQFYEQLQKSIASASDLEDIAGRKGIQIVEPFLGLQSADKSLHVLGPTTQYYEELVAGFEDPSKDQSLAFADAFKSLLKGAVEKLQDLWTREALQEPEEGATRPQNNSSVILVAILDSDSAFLFTGDAGAPALDRAVTPELAASLRPCLRYFQLPHHGSKRNIGPSGLDRILGPRLPKGSPAGKLTAFISAAKDGEPKHPSKRVVNAAIRRGAKVVATQGSNHCYRSTDLPMRPGYVSIQPLEFTENYED